MDKALEQFSQICVLIVGISIVMSLIEVVAAVFTFVKAYLTGFLFGNQQDTEGTK